MLKTRLNDSWKTKDCRNDSSSGPKIDFARGMIEICSWHDWNLLVEFWKFVDKMIKMHGSRHSEHFEDSQTCASCQQYDVECNNYDGKQEKTRKMETKSRTTPARHWNMQWRSKKTAARSKKTKYSEQKSEENTLKSEINHKKSGKKCTHKHRIIK